MYSSVNERLLAVYGSAVALFLLEKKARTNGGVITDDDVQDAVMSAMDMASRAEKAYDRVSTRYTGMPIP